MRLNEISKKEFKGRLSGGVKTCPGCKGKGHRADHDEPMDDEYCAVCAGTGKVATKGTKECPDCKGKGHYADDDEPMDDEYCYTCAGTGEVGPDGIPKYNPGLDPDMEPPPDPDYLKRQKKEREEQAKKPVVNRFKPRKELSKFQNKVWRALWKAELPEGVRRGSSFVTGWNEMYNKHGIRDTYQVPILVTGVLNAKKAASIVAEWAASEGIPKPHKRSTEMYRAEYGQPGHTTVSLFYGPDETRDVKAEKKKVTLSRSLKNLSADGIDRSFTYVMYGEGNMEVALRIRYEDNDRPVKAEVVEYVESILRKAKLPTPTKVTATSHKYYDGEVVAYARARYQTGSY